MRKQLSMPGDILATMSRGRNNRHYQFDLGRAFLVLTAASIAFAVLRMLGWSTITALVVPYLPAILLIALLDVAGRVFERWGNRLAERRAGRAAAEWTRLASELQMPPEAVLFVGEALRCTPKYLEQDGLFDDPSRHCSGQDMCKVFLHVAKDHLGSDYAAVLRRWGLDTSEKLGAVVYALVAEGKLLAQEGDRPSDFDGQFDLTQPPR